MPVTGTLIAESMRVGSVLEGVDADREQDLARRRRRCRCRSAAHVDVPRVRGFPTRVSSALANALENVLLDVGGWYCDFRNAQESFVVFAGRTFRYPRGDRSGRAQAEEHGRSVGVPAAQLDWPDLQRAAHGAA